MKLQITGNLRSVANSAWVSTLDEAKADSKTDEEVIRITKFLVAEHHTTPFECVTLSYSFDTDDEHDDNSYWEMAQFLNSHYVKLSENLTIVDMFANKGMAYVTTDLFNFIKICKSQYGTDKNYQSYKDATFWKLFEAQDPLLASVVDEFKMPEPYTTGAKDVSDILGPNGINVELVELHNPGNRDHIRATWRICCPLSIAVQLLRSRTGSFNMSSSRYRTANLDIVDFYDDVKTIYRKFIPENYNGYGDLDDKENTYLPNLDFEEALGFGWESLSMKAYSWAMKEAKSAKVGGIISNDEYKRFREFARYILPEGRMTELYATFYLPDFLHYLQLRDSDHAQIEHIHVAQLMKKEINSHLIDKI